MQKTPLHAVHVALGARMGEFGGWDMPIQYEGILAEHAHTREKSSIFDTCHMGEFAIRGPTAEADLEQLLTMNVATIKEGQCRYGFMLNEAGGVVDDLTCYRRGPDHFFLVVNAGTLTGDAEWISSRMSKGTTFTNLSPTRAKIDIQGPTSRTEMEKVLGHALPDLGYFRFTDTALAGMPCTLSRTGYTGEWGYEIYFPANEAERIWNLFTKGTGIKPAGLGARDTLRLEMGYSLYGHELNAELSPALATRGTFINMDKEFIGKDAVARDLAKPSKLLVALQLHTKRAARAHDKVMNEDQVVGEVTSGSLSPSLGQAIAMAYVDADLAEVGQKLQIDVRGKDLDADVVTLPFYKNGSARKVVV